MDFRRSGAVEADAGNVDRSYRQDGELDRRQQALQETYLPHRAEVVRLADQARRRGREALRKSEHGRTKAVSGVRKFGPDAR